MINKFHGKQPCSSMHPCYICPAPKDDLLNPDFPLENAASAMGNYNAWTLNSGKREELKDYNNQEFPPVGVEHMSEEELQEPNLLRTPMPPLHLLLSTNHLVSALEKVWESLARDWIQQTFQRFLNKKKILWGNPGGKPVLKTS